VITITQCLNVSGAGTARDQLRTSRDVASSPDTGPMAAAQHAIIIAENAVRHADPAKSSTAAAAQPPSLHHRLVQPMNGLLRRP